MKSHIVRLNKTGKYFKVHFNIFNSIELVQFTDERDKATLFQESSNINIVEFHNGEIMVLGSVRQREFNLFCHEMGIKKEDITIEELDVQEQQIKII